LNNKPSNNKLNNKPSNTNSKKPAGKLIVRKQNPAPPKKKVEAKVSRKFRVPAAKEPEADPPRQPYLETQPKVFIGLPVTRRRRWRYRNDVDRNMRGSLNDPAVPFGSSLVQRHIAFANRNTCTCPPGPSRACRKLKQPIIRIQFVPKIIFIGLHGLPFSFQRIPPERLPQNRLHSKLQLAKAMEF